MKLKLYRINSEKEILNILKNWGLQNQIYVLLIVFGWMKTRNKLLRGAALSLLIIGAAGIALAPSVPSAIAAEEDVFQGNIAMQKATLVHVAKCAKHISADAADQGEVAYQIGEDLLGPDQFD